MFTFSLFPYFFIYNNFFAQRQTVRKKDGWEKGANREELNPHAKLTLSLSFH